MKTLLLLRGAPGCGKSTWVKEQGLETYTLCADTLRLMCQSPLMYADGTEGISQKNDHIVWKMLYELLEIRLQKGEFTVIDATNSTSKELKRYKELGEKYRYRMYCVDFTDIPIDEVKRRNAGRTVEKRVPEQVINRMYARFASEKVPSGIKVIRPEELDTVWLKKVDFSHYKKVHHIGDIHGCHTVLQKYLSENGGMKDDELYIFLGDYVDRGMENAEVMNFLLSIMEQKNVLLLEGNHERWLWLYANEQGGASREFELLTKQALDEAGVDKKELRKFYRKLVQCVYYQYGDKVIFASHGGLSFLPENLTFVGTEQLIKGAGEYKEAEKMAETFLHSTAENVYQIHGHRNLKDLPVQVNERVFNLEGKVEFGGCLRVVQVDSEGMYPVEVKNEVFKTPEMKEEETVVHSSMAGTIIALRESKYILERKFGNISSFNFTKKAFREREWNEQTTKARGLYVDMKRGKVAARAYEKFFNIGEREETKLEALQRRFAFPVTAYVKENGFLGIVSYDEYHDELLIGSKAMLDNSFAQWLKDLLYQTVSAENMEKLKAFIKEEDVTFVFECVDMEHDPHIIAYPKSQLFLLDIVKNDMKFEKYSYEKLSAVAETFGLQKKKKAFVIENWQEFCDWHEMVTQENYQYEGEHIEGFVIEDTNGYMVKLKLAYYQYWKFLRNVSEETIKMGYVRSTAVLPTAEANEFYHWLKEMRNTKGKENLPWNICSLRKMFYESKERS